MNAVLRVVEPTTTEALTDLGNAARYRRDHEGSVLWSHALGFLVWNGTHWERDTRGEVQRAARATLSRMFGDAAKDGDAGLAHWAARSASRPRLEAMIELAKSEPGIACDATIFDRNPWLLNTASGTVDLKTGEISAHESWSHLTKMAPTFYSTSARCPTFQTFLDRIMAGDVALIEFLQRAIGYTLTGLTVEQVLFLLWGVGANGKTTLTEVLKTTLGTYALQADPSTFTSSRSGSGPREDIARLRGARFVVTTETEHGAKLAEALVKQVSGGESLVARNLYRESFEFKPAFKLWLATNHKPIIRGTDYAIWRRIRLVPFTVTIPEAERDKGLTERLLSEGAGILRWAVEGCLAWQKGGLQEPEAVLAATREYREEMDSLAGFIAERCIVSPGIAGMGLFNAYTAWARANGIDPIDAREFAQQLELRGHKRERKRSGSVYTGIGLSAEGDE